jgi:hypothetical protein
VELLKDGNEFMLVTVVKFSWQTGRDTFDVKVEIATIAPVGEATFETPTAGITISIF